MNVVVCPHCRQSVSIDNSLAGQVVGCPTCAGQFQTPAISLPMPPPNPVPAYPPPQYPPSTPYPVNYPQKPSKGLSGAQLGLLIGGGVGLLLLLPCCICTLPGLLLPEARVAPPPVADRSSDRPMNAVPPEVTEAIERKLDERKQQNLERPKEPPPKTEPVSEPKEQLTYAKFNQVKNGMSKREVIGILGSDYEVLSENEIGAGTQFRTHTEMLAWKQGGFSFGNCNVMFQNGKVMSKSHFGLK